MTCLPTLERARAELADACELLAEPPAQSFERAAIVLQSNVVRRELWADDVEMSEKVHAALPRGEVPAAVPGSSASHKVIPNASAGRRGRCTSCVHIKRGRMFCPTCNGSGLSHVHNDEPISCPACGGSGTTVCMTCDGDGVTVSTKILYANDRALSLRRCFVPALWPRVASAVEAAIDATASYDRRFAFELRPRVLESAYRGTAAVREPDFHGFQYRDAFARAVEAISALHNEAGIVALENSCFAVPLLWLVYGDAADPLSAAHVVVIARPDAALAALTI